MFSWGEQVGRIPFNEQVQNFENTLDQLSNTLGAEAVSRSLGQCLFFMGLGSNDYLNNYLMPNYPTSNQYNALQYANLLVQQYTNQLSVSPPTSYYYYHYYYYYYSFDKNSSISLNYTHTLYIFESNRRY